MGKGSKKNKFKPQPRFPNKQGRVGITRDPRALAPPIGQTYGGDSMFRPLTKVDQYPHNFFLSSGGMGDYICHMSAFVFIAKEHPQVVGRIFTTPPFDEVARFIMRDFPQWSVHEKASYAKIVGDGEMLYDPSNFRPKYLSAVGTHLLDLGFCMYANTHTPPKEYNKMVDLTGYKSGKTWPEIPEHYAVFTPGATAQTRQMRGAYINELSRHCKSKGVTPVYLGKANFFDMGQTSDYYAQAHAEFDPSLGVDLREKTSILEAVEIIKGAKFICGIDNGLLHFAGCTETPIIFGHTVTEIKHRDIRRPKGRTINIALTPESLPCTGCQSKMRFIPKHRFRYCIYGDYKCLDLLFANNCKEWKRAIDYILEGKTWTETPIVENEEVVTLHQDQSPSL